MNNCGPKIEFIAPVPVGVSEMAAARERRATGQRELLSRFNRPVVSFTMNIAGPVKDTPLIRLAFSSGLAAIHERLGPPLREDIRQAPTGPEALSVHDGRPELLKALTVEIESVSPLGRLFDIDVIAADGTRLSRGTPRRCVVCGRAAAECARSRAHGLKAVTGAMLSILRGHAATFLSGRAVYALLREARFTPKPGLVDEANNGAHTDMDLAMFERSAETLRPYFRRFVTVGAEEPDNFPPLASTGVEAEEAMLKATGGVNTHRGAIYAFGLLLGAIGASLEDGKNVFERAANLAKAQPSSADVTTRHDRLSHGEEARRRHGAGGARLEARLGFPTARSAAKALRERGELDALLFLLSRCEDTNLLYRGGQDGLDFVRRSARLILKTPSFAHAALANMLDRAMIRRNLSPGGCADLLALSLFINDVLRDN